MAIASRRGWTGAAAALALALLALGVCGLTIGQPANAAQLVAGRDGKVHACYKYKGRHRGTLRLVRSAKVRCSKKWRKVAWPVRAVPGPRGEAGVAGATGERGVPGTAGNVAVEELEGKVSELLTKVTNLESAIANLGALETTVSSLCTQTEALNGQTTALGTALSGFSAIVDTLTLLGLPEVPVALPSYTCPTF
ncbi:MAG TPA: hypothetical protein VFS26_10200 [Solirubrobacterales bacterium]|nr:hypothetical protein [Solirubrobacterales bacterium]